MAELLLDEETQLYCDPETCRVYSRVTREIRACGFMDDLDYVKERDLLKGRYLHEACHLFDMGRLDPSSVDPSLRPKFNGYLKAKEELGLVIIESELQVRNDAYGIAGTLDKIARIRQDDSIWLLDIKGGPPKNWHRIQTAIYDLCLPPGAAPRKRAGLHLMDNDYRLVPHFNRRDFKRAEAVLELATARREAA